jgi:hypothetical protein
MLLFVITAVSIIFFGNNMSDAYAHVSYVLAEDEFSRSVS